MRARAACTLLALIAVGCPKSGDAPPSEAPVVDAPEAEDDAPPPQTDDDPLDGLGGDGTSTTSSRPPSFEVTIDAVMTAETTGAKEITVGSDPRFPIHLKIEHVEPETPLLPPGQYVVIIHSPTHAFRGPTPAKGKRVTLRMSIYPESPDDPHDETFFSALWTE